MISVMSDGYQEWTQSVRRGGGSRQGSGDLGPFAVSAVGLLGVLDHSVHSPPVFHFFLQENEECCSFQIYSMREEGPRLSIPIKRALDY